jgi:F0F1-type ATP synthase assembly protein I
MNYPRQPSNKKNNNARLVRYAGLASQLVAAIGLSVFAGIKADSWLRTSPLFTCALPLLALAGIFYKIFRDTAPGKDPVDPDKKYKTPSQYEEEE